MQLAHGKALAWEMWRRGWYWFLVAIVAPAVLMLLLLMAGPHGDDLRSRALCRTRSRFVPHAFARRMMMFIAMLAQAQGGEAYELIVKRYYHLPIATRDLIAWRMTIGAVAIACMHIGVVLIFGASSGYLDAGRASDLCLSFVPPR